MTQADRACAVSMAAARDINNELTILVNEQAEALLYLAPEHPSRPRLIEAQQAAQRIIWKTSGLLNYGARRGVRPVNSTMERLILADAEAQS